MSAPRTVGAERHDEHAATCQLVLTSETDAAGRARQLVAQHLPDLSPDLRDDAQLVVSELVTNAMLHGQPPVTVTVTAAGRDHVRVEVTDQGDRLPVVAVQSPDAMTGRGLSLVTALSTSWGADPVGPSSRDGKTVWAELTGTTRAAAAAPDLDLDAFLAAWQDDEPAEREYTVRLGQIPTDLLLEAKRHIDNVVRELTFERAAAAGPLPAELETLIDTVTGSFARARSSIKEQAVAAATRGDAHTELVLTLPASSVEAGERYLTALDEADRYARASRLLTLETPPLHRVFRRWYVTALVEQLRAHAAGTRPAPPRSFAQVLADEVASLTARPPAEQLDAHEAAPTPTSPQVLIGRTRDTQLLTLADTARAIAGARSVEELLEVVTEAARSVVGAHQGVGTRLYRGSWENATTYVSLSDKYASYRDYDVVPKGLGILNVVTSENRPVRLTGEELAAHPQFRALRDAPGHPPLPDYLAAPFISRDGRNIGLLQLADKLDGTAFTDADEAVCVQLALMVSSALEHLEVGQQLEGTLVRLRKEQEAVGALHDVGRAVLSRLEHDDVVQVVTDAATQMTGAQFGAFFYTVIGDAGESFNLYTISGVPREAFSRFPMPRNTDIFAPTFNGDGVVRLDDVTADPRYGHSAPHHGMPAGHLPVRSYLAVPVRLSTGEVIGGLFFGHEDVGVFDDDAERLAVGIAGYASIALENGRLYDAARRESRAKQQIAAALEKPLQPPVLPQIPGAELASAFLPFSGATGLAGDFYDAFELRDGRWLLALGDVSGKGPEAAAVTGLVRHTLWAAAQLSTDPLELLHVLNDALLRERSERFATLVLAVVSPDHPELAVDAAWAGHPAGLLLRDGRVEPVAGAGMPVGLFPDADFASVRLTLQPGDGLVLYTDGLVERQGAVLTDEQLLEIVRGHATESLPTLLSAVTAHIDALHDRRDDVAALAVRCLEQAARP